MWFLHLVKLKTTACCAKMAIISQNVCVCVCLIVSMHVETGSGHKAAPREQDVLKISPQSATRNDRAPLSQGSE